MLDAAPIRLALVRFLLAWLEEQSTVSVYTIID